MQRVWVWECASITVALDKLTWWSHENTCLARAEAASFHSSRPTGVLKVMIQGPACLADVGVGTFGRRDAVHHSLPAVCWTWVLQVH